jgi:drug/metabolite transporter (DMT)-like permease
VYNDSLLKAIYHMILASFCFAFTGAVAKYLGTEFSAIQLVFFRNVIGLLPILYFFYKEPFQSKLGGKPGLLFFRGFIGTLALYFFFYGVTTIGLAESITYQQSYPIFLALVSTIVLKNKLSTNAWIAIAIGFIGICMIFIPKVSDSFLEMKSQIIGVSNMLMTGLAYISIRGLSNYYDNKHIVLSFILCGILFPVISMFIGNFYFHSNIDFLVTKVRYPEARHFFPILVLGLAAFVGQIYLTKAFSHKNTGMVGAVGYTNIAFSILFGIILGDPLPSMIGFIGISFIMISGIVIGFESKNEVIDKDK